MVCVTFLLRKWVDMYTQLNWKNHQSVRDWKFKYPILHQRLFELHGFPLESQEFPDEELVLLLSCLSQKYTRTQVLHYLVKDSSSYRLQTPCKKSALCGSPEHQDTNQESILRSIENSLQELNWTHFQSNIYDESDTANANSVFSIRNRGVEPYKGHINTSETLPTIIAPLSWPTNIRLLSWW